ncbi:MAG: outer membrane beta-barrel protein [Bdellovibrionales bacterium]|nr:outer membrane beta-barrel protein [Bdellovibrionales bacterium]
MKRMTLFVLVLICSIASQATAQPRPFSHEVEGSAGFFHAQDADTGTINADVSYGYYLGDQAWQVGIEQGLDWKIVDDQEDVWTASTVPFLNYHFLTDDPSNTVIPFIGVFGGAIYNDDDGTGTIGPRAGVKIFVSDNTFVGAKYRYEWFFDDLDLDNISDESSEGNHVVAISLGYNWGGEGR